MSSLYLWQEPEWPHFTWDAEELAQLLAEVHQLLGRLSGQIAMFGFDEQSDTALDAVTQGIIDSAKIEGQMLNRDSVRSSVARHLGLPLAGIRGEDHYVRGIVNVMFDATENYAEALTAERLFKWHTTLFPYGVSEGYQIVVGAYRQSPEPMVVVSGPMGHYTVHYEAPPAEVVPSMMDAFLDWVENGQGIDPLIKTAIAHLWFVTIHPFDDGNGRLCRTISELLLARTDGMSQRYYSLSSAILENRNAYYDHLEQAQKGDINVTEWVKWFLQTLRLAVNNTLDRLSRIAQKTDFWNRHATLKVNERQRKVVNRLWDGFEGKLNTSKWAKMCHCSQDTALRDIQDLVRKGILRSTGEGGRSTSYELADGEV